MKKTSVLTCFIWFAIIFTELSCSKPSNTIQHDPVATLSFSTNGSSFQWGGSNTCIACTPAIIKYQDYYILTASEPQNYSNDIALRIQSTTLSASSYTLTVTNTTPIANVFHSLFLTGPYVANEIMAASTEVGDFATVTISSIHDRNYADGTFTAKITLSPYGASNKLDITNGEFHNVKIL